MKYIYHSFGEKKGQIIESGLEGKMVLWICVQQGGSIALDNGVGS